MPLTVSKSKVDRAGALLRQWYMDRPRTRFTDEEVTALDVIWEYRTIFQPPLTKVTVGLRYYVNRTSPPEVIVAQRLKRMPRIVEKLDRHPTLRLSQMQDIGGCRAVLPEAESVDEVLDGIRRNWDVIMVDDYVTTPKPSTGYRGVHAIVKKDEVPIEVQLRTPGQQDWAEAVERIDGRQKLRLKDGIGPPDLVRYFREVSEAVWLEETDQEVPRNLQRELTDLQAGLGQYLR